MKERDNTLFYTFSDRHKTPDIETRANSAYIQKELAKRFTEKLTVKNVTVNLRGTYPCGLLFKHTRKGLPPYVSVKIEHSTGKHTETILVWSPLAWNDRFVGCPGGGMSVGGEQYIGFPDNTSRGMTLTKAVLNGFTGATTDGGAKKREWALDENGKRDRELIENWRARSTHFMTLAGKAVAEILHQRPVKYSYLHGGSGGGRQSMVEVQEYPADYDGVWASCPAIHWSKFLLLGFWANAVMNAKNHFLSCEKMNFFMTEAQNTVGGKEKYYRYEGKVAYDPRSSVGKKFGKKEIITERDADVMKEIWDGPHDKEGNLLAFYHRPGVCCWNKILPVGAFYYPLFSKKPKPFFLSTYYARWITENPKETFENITPEEWYALYEKSIALFRNCLADSPDLTEFKIRGGKLIIDHGLDDPLIPVDGTIAYYKALTAFFGDPQTVDSFVKLYLTPGDGHGTCNWHGPGITERDGMTALIDWVEKGIVPADIRVVQVDRRGNTLIEASRSETHSVAQSIETSKHP